MAVPEPAEQFDWDDLLLRVRTGGVIPIIGREVATIRDSPQLLVEDALAVELARELRINIEGLDRPSLADVARLHLAKERTQSSNALYSKLRQVMDRVLPTCGVPEPLGLLSAITDFGLFVTTTADSLMQKALTTP